VIETDGGLARAIGAAEESWRRGDWSHALEAYRALLSRRLAEGLSAGRSAAQLTATDLVIVERLADLAAPFGAVRAADDLLAAMADLCEEAGNLVAADYATLKRLRLALGSGSVGEAMERLRSLSPGAGDPGSIRFTPAGLADWGARRAWPGAGLDDRLMLLTHACLEFGRLLSTLGRYGEAELALRRGLELAEGPAPDLARRAADPLRLAIASARLERGELDSVEEILGGIAARPNADRSPDLAIRRAEIIGKARLLRGDLGAALREFARAGEIGREAGFGRAATLAAINLAHLLISVNQTATAESILRDARGSALAVGSEALADRAEALLQVARARARSLVEGSPINGDAPVLPGPPAGGDGDDGRGLLELPQSGNFLTFFEDRALGFYWLLGRGDLDAADDRLDGLHAVFDGTDSDLIRLRLSALDAVADYYHGRYEGASAVLERICPAFEAMGLKPDLWQSLRVLGWCRARLGREGAGRDEPAERAQAVLDEVASSLDAGDREIFRLNKWTADEEALAARLDAIVCERDAIAAGSWFSSPRRRWLLWRELDDLLRYIGRHKRSIHREATDGTSADVPERVRPLWWRLLTHPPGRATISFLVLPDRVLIARSGWLSMGFGVSPVTRTRVREVVGRWHLAVSGLGEEGTDPAEGALRSVADLAVEIQFGATLAALPRRVGGLSVVPDDALHGFPFPAALVDGRPLIERFALTIGFEDGPRRPRAPGKAGGLVVGVERGTETIPPLPGTRPEVEQVVAWLSGRRVAADLRVDDDAGRDAILGRLARVRFAHLACHGIFRRDRPDASGLVLVPRPEVVEVLSIRDLACLDLAGLEHVTLSACWSADNFVLPGRWVISLPETLCRAGTRSVVGCLWPVEDHLSGAFMRRFYEALARAPRDEALRIAQRDCLEGRLTLADGRPAKSPIFWAGYHLYGDHRRLKLGRSGGRERRTVVRPGCPSRSAIDAE
jgi:hypothetical protein